MAKLYHIQRRKDHRRFTPLSVFIVVVGTAAVLFGAFVWYNSRDSAVTVDNSRNKPINSTIEPADADYKLVEEVEFTMKLPPEWREDDRRFDENFQYITYVADDEKTTGREMTVYIGEQHELDPVTKIVPVTTGANSLSPAKISPQCSSFTNFEDKQAVQETARWEGVSFPCSPNEITNYIGVGVPDEGYGFELRGQKFYIRYTDHSARMDNSVFLNILRSFQAV